MISIEEYWQITDRWKRERVVAGLRTDMGKSYRASRVAPYNAAEAGIMLRLYYPEATAIVFTLHEDTLGITATVERVLGEGDHVLYDDARWETDGYFEEQSDVGDPLATAAQQLVKRGDGRENLGGSTGEAEEDFDNWVERLAKGQTLFRANSSGEPNLGATAFRYDLAS